MQIVVNVVNTSGPFLFFNKNVQPSPAHWRQHFILRLGALAAAPPSGPVNIVNRESTVDVSMTVRTHQVHSRTQASASFTTQMNPSFFYSNPPCWYLGPTSFSTYSQLTAELHNFFCYCWGRAGFQLGRGPSSLGLYFTFTTWPAQPFFLCENEPSLFFLKNTQSKHSESGEDCSCEYDSTDPPGPLPNTSKRLFYYSDAPLIFYSNPPCWYLAPTSFSTYSQVNRERTVVVSTTVRTHQVHSRTQASASFTTQMHLSFFTLIHPADIWHPHHFQRIVN